MQLFKFRYNHTRTSIAHYVNISMCVLAKLLVYTCTCVCVCVCVRERKEKGYREAWAACEREGEREEGKRYRKEPAWSVCGRTLIGQYWNVLRGRGYLYYVHSTHTCTIQYVGGHKLQPYVSRVPSSLSVLLH